MPPRKLFSRWVISSPAPLPANYEAAGKDAAQHHVLATGLEERLRMLGESHLNLPEEPLRTRERGAQILCCASNHLEVGQVPI